MIGTYSDLDSNKLNKLGCFYFNHYPYKGYNYVGLNIMAEWANKKREGMFKEIKGFNIPHDKDLKELGDTIKKKIENNDGNNKVIGSFLDPVVPEWWKRPVLIDPNQEWLHPYANLRKKFLHFSTNYKRSSGAHVNTPNYDMKSSNKIKGILLGFDKVYNRKILL